MEILRKIKNKITFGAIIFLLAAAFLSSTAMARYTVPSGATGGTNALDEYKQALEEPNTNLPQWSLFNLGYISQGLTRMMVGLPVLTGEQASGGAAGVLASLIGDMYQNKPVSSGEYLADLGRRLEIVKPAYAQGKGWQFLEPVLPLWQALRDLSYLFFVVIFVAIGLMIMFRAKLDPQTVISVQSALPKIIMSLIVITFSYAICGLIVDLIFLANGLLHAIFEHVFAAWTCPTEDSATAECAYVTTIDIWTAAAGLMGSIMRGAGGGIRIPVFSDIGDIVSAISKAFTGDFANLVNLLLAFTIIGTIFKIFLALLGRYVIILLYTIFSPLILLWGTLPGQSDHFSKFFKSLLGAAITFPAMILLFNFASFFSMVNFPSPLQTLQPFDLPGTTPPPHILGVLPNLIALGILMAAAKIPETIDDALSIKSGVSSTLGAEAGGALRKIPIVGALLG